MSAASGRYVLVQAVTLVRIPLAIAFSALLLSSQKPFSPTVLIVGSGLLVLSEITDFLDGQLARRLGVVSETGAMLDPYSDSVSRLIVYWSLASVGLALAFVPLVMAIRDVTIAYCRITWVRQGKSVSAKWSGKIKAAVQGVCAFLLLWSPVYRGPAGAWVVPALSWLVIAVTVYSAIDYLRPKS
ncbi:MAG: CDP-alcohol phosphatidyltransferase family protein [Planctomycetes bacterium]|nr:CDP-alcohol phosphatidyltransferase family protein [Planctomycetota bacterium]